ncbi:MAG: TonB-dependent receptor [Chlorobi bacterium]|nr:TonB-dependent receptor [Chlorobiota bacterium]
MNTVQTNIFNVILFILIFSINISVCSAKKTYIEKKITISGYVKDAQTGENLTGATILIKETGKGSTANSYGFYSISLTPGTYHLTFSFIGYDEKEIEIKADKDFSLNILLEPGSEQLQEIVITSQQKDHNITSPLMGNEKLLSNDIKQIPVLMGETDLIKVLQLMPGVQATSEGSSGFSVRGGNPDQNLILLDEATVYNAGHFLGFFSVFNNDAINSVELYKGYIPASSGGRISSLLNIRMKEGNKKKFSGTAGIGTIASRFTLEGPIIKDRTSFIVSARRTYLDLLIPVFAKDDMKDNRIYFYDLNAKVNHTLNKNNHFYLSGYFGRDVFRNEFSKMDFGNKTFTARWNHVYNPRLFSNLTLIYSNYDYGLGTIESGANSFEWKSNLKDWSLKADFNYYMNTSNTISFGGQTTYHDIMPGNAYGKDEDDMYNEIRLANTNSLEHAIYISNTQNITQRFVVKYGLRFSIFQNIGPGTLFEYDDNYNVTGEREIKKGEIYNTYTGLEPRISLSYILTPGTSVKASYSRTKQYLNMASNSTSSSPLDIWFPASPNVKPQTADQYSVGFFKNIFSNKVETSLELFYKNMQNTIDFKDHAELLLNEHLEGELRFGKSWSYGAEIFVRYNLNNWKGWISYTRLKAERKIDGVNNNKTYLSPYDHTNDISLVVNHRISERSSFAANWVFYTGAPVTLPVGRYESGGVIVPLYSDRNEERMPNYHRLDLSFTLHSKNKKQKQCKGEWVFSVYNAYYRKNAWVINFENDDDNPLIIHARMTYLFSIIPAITYNIKF